MIRRLLLASLLVFSFGPAVSAQQLGMPGGAQAFGTGSPALVVLRIELAKPAGGKLGGVALAEIEPGWHIASAKPLDEFTIPTVLSLESASLQLLSVAYPPHVVRKFDFSEGKIAVYEGTIRIPFEAKVTGGPGPVLAKLRYQACNDTICLPPTTVTAKLQFVGPSAGVAPAGGSPASASEQAPSAADTSRVGRIFSAHGLGLTLLIVFLGGLALNLTPCVYPLIPITIAFFASQAKGRRGQRVALSLLYVLGLAATYSVLGVFAALSGRLFGSWLQLPAVLIGFAVLMLALAASMFGLYEIRIPHAIADKAGARAGYAGAVTMGLLVGIVAAPCVGPFVASLIALVGQIGKPSIGFILFFALALGLGAPYLVLGFFSSAIAAMPRSGMWMDQVKKAMGFVLIAMAFYFLRPLAGETVYTWGVAASLVIGAAFLFFAKKAKQTGGNILRWSLAALLLAAGVLFAIPARESNMTWIPYSDAALASARASGKPVIIDFFAAWCIPCKELDAKTFSDEQVVRDSERFVRLKADLTLTDKPEVVALRARYRITGIPSILFLDGSGNEVSAVRLTGFEHAAPFLKRLAAVH